MAEPDPPQDETPPEGAAAGDSAPDLQGGATMAAADPAPSEHEPGPGPRDGEAAQPPSPPRKGGFARALRRLVLLLVAVAILGPVIGVLAFRFIPPPVTYLMVQRAIEGRGLDHRWRPISRISPSLTRAVIAAEDARFCEHHGFDFEAMRQAFESNARRPGRIRGGSTISQQTAKNVFLWPGRSYIRKGLEAYYTVLIELLWGKRRIMEVYLNSVEWGPGVYGAEAAARKWFGVGAARLTNAQAARLAAILPSPLKWKAAGSGPYVRRRSSRIGAATGTVRREGLDSCVG